MLKEQATELESRAADMRPWLKAGAYSDLNEEPSCVLKGREAYEARRDAVLRGHGKAYKLAPTLRHTE